MVINLNHLDPMIACKSGRALMLTKEDRTKTKPGKVCQLGQTC